MPMQKLIPAFHKLYSLVKIMHMPLRKTLSLILLSAALPWTGFGGAVVTKSAELLQHLGYGGKAEVKFDIDVLFNRNNQPLHTGANS
jgi:hypothetical protein